MPRVKIVHPPDMVAHLWAHQAQDEARTSRDNFYFRGSTIFSYGPHFPVADLRTRKGKTVCLLTTRTYSVTTAGHINAVAYAVRGVHPVIRCLHPLQSDQGRTHKDNLEEFRRRIQETATRAARSRCRAEQLWADVASEVDNANEYARFFGLRSRFVVPSDTEVKAQIAKQSRAAKAARAAAEKKQQQAIAEAQERVELWINGKVHDFPRIIEKTYLRIHGDELQTSKGASVPLAHAMRILPLIRSGRPYKHNGHSEHVGQFRIDEIDDQGNVKAGCHYITRDEIERVAATIQEAT